ncbi:GPS-CTERM domain-containing protein [Streptomyces sp. CC228A]|uniref:GPS-CTERM domain-containing protein n=1 Tax=Streptomyces sp. CC228A TaxID=2898186 RepID=UPI0022A8BD9C|nr:GPS-CTERM domain-containing protein [Streptomyces sp. CC228A]
MRRAGRGRPGPLPRGGRARGARACGPEAADSGGGPSVGLAAGLAAVLLLGAAAVVRARRRGHR